MNRNVKVGLKKNQNHIYSTLLIHVINRLCHTMSMQYWNCSCHTFFILNINFSKIPLKFWSKRSLEKKITLKYFRVSPSYQQCIALFRKDSYVNILWAIKKIPCRVCLKTPINLNWICLCHVSKKDTTWFQSSGNSSINCNFSITLFCCVKYEQCTK